LASDVVFESRKRASNVPETDNIAPPRSAEGSSFLVEPAPAHRAKELERRSLLLDWSRVDVDGLGSAGGWGPGWSPAPRASTSSSAPASTPSAPAPSSAPAAPVDASSRAPIFGGAAVAPNPLPPVPPPEPATPAEEVTLVSAAKPATPVTPAPVPAPVEKLVETPAEKPQQLALPPYPGHGAPAPTPAPAPPSEPAAARPEPKPEPKPTPQASKPVADEPKPRPVSPSRPTPQPKAPAAGVQNAQQPKPNRTGIIIGGIVAIAMVAAVVVFTQSGGADKPTPPPAPTEQVKAPEPENKAPETQAPETKPAETAKPETATPETKPVETPATAAQTAVTDAGTPPKATEPAAVAANGTPAAGDDGKDDEPEQPAAQQLSPEAQYANLTRQAKKLMTAGRYKTAAFSYRKALALKPDSAEAKAGLGISLVRSDSSYREAVKLLEDALKDQPNNAHAWLCLGMGRQMVQQDKKAIDAYKRYLSLEPKGQYANDVRAALKSLGQ
ncbi:MAG TPA: tetratricopeptide repeat protein, partial [Archangium sp.]|nr:tetratricopeptide repeat protein [Archangium sp.]